MTINKRIRRIFWKHKSTYIGIVLLIILSTSCFYGLKTASMSVEQNVFDNRISTNLESANFKLLNRLSQAELEGLQKKFNIELQENKEIEYPYNKAVLRVRPAYTNINKFSVYAGETLKNPNDILVDIFFFKVQKLSFGDIINVGGSDFVVCGTFTSPDYLSVLKSKTDFMADGSKFGLCIVKSEAFNVIAKGKETISYSVVYHQNNIENFKKELSSIGTLIEYTAREANSRIITFDGEIEAMVMISQIAPMFILFVSSLIVAFVIGRMIKKEYIYIGTLIALGYKKSIILRHYLTLPLIISFIGSIIGLFSGFLLVMPVAELFSVEYSVPKPMIYHHFKDAIIVLVLPAVLNIVTTFFFIIRAFYINTVSLLKDNTQKQKKGILTRLIPHKKGSFKLRFKLKEITSNLPRSIVMLIGVTAASLFIITGFIFDSSVKFLFQSNFHEIFGYEYQYILKQPQTDNKAKGEPYMIWGFEYVKNAQTYAVSLNGVADNSKYIKLFSDDGELIPEDKTVVTKSAAKRLGLNKGDKLTLINNSDLKKYEIIVDEICTVNYSGNIYLPMARMNKMLGLPETTYVGLYSDEKLNIDQQLVDKVLTSDDSKAGLEVSIASFRILLYIMAFFAAVIGMVVVYIVTVMLVEENRKNISMLKVIGYQNKEISRLVIKSTSILVWFSYLLAIPITINVIQKLFDAITKNMFIAFEARVELWQGLIGFLFIIGIYYITLALSKRRVLNINMAESLKLKE